MVRSFGERLGQSRLIRCCELDARREQVLDASAGLLEMFGLAAPPLPMPVRELFTPADWPIAERAIANLTDETLVHARRADGSSFLAELRFDGMFMAMEDVSVRRAAEERLRLLALHDPLTGLPNRVLLQDRIRLGLLEARRANTLLAVMVLDLNGFKQVNDRFGHRVGDEVLRVAARRFSHAARATDTVARVGGDEFVVVSSMERREDAALLAGRMVQSLNEPIGVQEHAHAVGVSVGIAVSPDDGEDLDQLFVGADRAMYDAKRAGTSVAFAERSRSEVRVLHVRPWTEDLCVGVRRVDDEHRGLVAALNAVVSCVAARADAVEVNARMETLLLTARSHFDTEELLMMEAHYEGRAAHAREHRNLLMDLETLRGTTDPGGGVTITLRHLDRWLMEHIEAFDRETCRALIALEEAAAAERH